VPGAALIAFVAIFLPSFLLLLGVLPFWNVLRERPGFQSALSGINAAVVGLLAAALRPWMVVGLGAAAGAAVHLLS
jgi:chromate transporter